MPSTTGMGYRMREFQSAPGREAGRCESLRERKAYFLTFQSAPGREAGRCSSTATCCLHSEAVSVCANLRRETMRDEGIEVVTDS